MLQNILLYMKLCILKLKHTDTLAKAILLIKNKIKATTSFWFNEISLVDIEKEILWLNPKKVGTSPDMPPKLLKNSSTLLCIFKWVVAGVKSIFLKKKVPQKLKITDQWVCYQLFHMFLKE